MGRSKRDEDLRYLGNLAIVILIGVFFAGFALGILAGCKTTQNIKKEDRSKTYNVSKDVLFTTVVDEVTANGYMIDNVNKELGIISTKPKTGAIRKTFQAQIKSVSESKSELILTLNYEYTDGVGYSSFPLTGANKDFYQNWFNRIDSAIRYAQASK